MSEVDFRIIQPWLRCVARSSFHLQCTSFLLSPHTKPSLTLARPSALAGVAVAKPPFIHRLAGRSSWESSMSPLDSRVAIHSCT